MLLTPKTPATVRKYSWFPSSPSYRLRPETPKSYERTIPRVTPRQRFDLDTTRYQTRARGTSQPVRPQSAVAKKRIGFYAL
jgi:hypothetical protein